MQKSSQAQFETRLITDADEEALQAFDCGDHTMNAWVRRNCIVNQAEGYTRSYGHFKDGRLLGFYSICPTIVSREGFFTEPGATKAPNPIPCILLARLGVALEFQRAKIGTSLLRDFFSRALEGGKVIGGHAVIVDVSITNQKAQKFYAKLGFKAMNGLFTRYFLPLETIRKAVNSK